MFLSQHERQSFPMDGDESVPISLTEHSIHTQSVQPDVMQFETTKHEGVQMEAIQINPAQSDGVTQIVMA
jgi:hypothetical protein